MSKKEGFFFGAEKSQWVTNGLKSSFVLKKEGKSESQQGLDSHLYSTALRQILNAVALEHVLESML